MSKHSYERAASEEHSDDEDGISMLEMEDGKLEDDLEDQKPLERPKRSSTSLMIWIVINIMATIGIVRSLHLPKCGDNTDMVDIGLYKQGHLL
jgi:hypothetical protein